jgi:hypothetical protein
MYKSIHNLLYARVGAGSDVQLFSRITPGEYIIKYCFKFLPLNYRSFAPYEMAAASLIQTVIQLYGYIESP